MENAPQTKDNAGLAPEDREACLRVLQAAADDPALIAGDERLKALVAKVNREGKRGVRQAQQKEKQAADRQTVSETGLVHTRRYAGGGDTDSLATTISHGDGLKWGELQAPAKCYVCKRGYTRVHPWYHMLCPDCATLNAAKRVQRADLSGRAALVTGGRVKIGFALALRLLRDGARVVVTTRFPADATRRFSALPDSSEWWERLRIVGLDLRHLPDVERFADAIAADEPPLDILVNNAAQTVRRPEAFYRHILDAEQSAQATVTGLPSSDSPLVPRLAGAALPDAAGLERYFPPGLLDGDGQQVDLRPIHSWRLRLGEVGTVEMLEVLLVNTAAPFVLCSRLRPSMLRSPFPRRFVVNVSAMEGQFARESKTVYHPHTNMAKAALNMLTRTSAADYARDGIYMNSVDTGWVTDENPHPQRVKAQEERGFWTPLDIEDAVARIYDPIVQGLGDAAEPLSGHFLKDFNPYAW